ncbi:MAG: hypothetical protein PHI41_06015 [Erysipelotrichaceae bacterium]|nr:hypothetical protein [Erysipelotrichaceae bacterium]MDD3810239.1 hypothetical protein [Erysipelotrichaceae bacterium]
MKIVALNYAPSDFKRLEQRLNDYSQAGYNPRTVGKVAILKKGPRKHYLAVPFVSYQTQKKEIAAQKVEWFKKMAMLDSEYLGQVSGIHVFSSVDPIEYKMPYEPLGEYFLKGELLKRVLKALAILFVGVALIRLIYSGEVSQYLTNGRIMLEWVLYFGVAIGVMINVVYGYQAVQVGKIIAARQDVVPGKGHERLRLAKIGVSLFFCLLLLGGFWLDGHDNDRHLEDITQVISLKTLGVDSPNFATQFTTNHSYLIPYSYSYYEQAGAVDENAGELGDLLQVNYYVFSSKDLQDRIFQDYLDLDSHNLDHLDKIDDGVYLGYDKSLGLYSNMYINNDEVCLVVYTNFDLTANNRIQAILDNYLVD